MRIDEVLGRIEWRPGAGQVGVHPVSVVVRDSSALETTQSFEVSVGASPPTEAAPSQP
jgi:ABC-type enterochelin transport system substrate-binding protein